MLTKTTVCLCRMLAVAAIAMAVGRPALAQAPTPQPGPASQHGPAPRNGDGNASSQAFQAAQDRMMHGMGAPLSGDADRDFVAGMIPHHQGAIDMARIELEHGKDPALRRMAQEIIKAQEKEIAEMKQWQAKHHAAH